MRVQRSDPYRPAAPPPRGVDRTEAPPASATPPPSDDPLRRDEDGQVRDCDPDVDRCAADGLRGPFVTAARGRRRRRRTTAAARLRRDRPGPGQGSRGNRGFHSRKAGRPRSRGVVADFTGSILDAEMKPASRSRDRRRYRFRKRRIGRPTAPRAAPIRASASANAWPSLIKRTGRPRASCERVGGSAGRHQSPCRLGRSTARPSASKSPGSATPTEATGPASRGRARPAGRGLRRTPSSDLGWLGVALHDLVAVEDDALDVRSAKVEAEGPSSPRGPAPVHRQDGAGANGAVAR